MILDGAMSGRVDTSVGAGPAKVVEVDRDVVGGAISPAGVIGDTGAALAIEMGSVDEAPKKLVALPVDP